jgi:hypothetical protein
MPEGQGKREGEHTPEEIVQQAKDNHIWINRFNLVRPKDEFLRDLGQAVVNALRNTEMTDDLIGQTPVVYMRFNAS